jgi:uncharacterized membrane protein YkvA (DUF1232 family)
MTDKKSQSLNLPKKAKEGFFREFYNNLKLIIRLLKDSRVNFWLKILPIGALIYLVFPMDFFPINPLDDALVVWLGGYLFIELCPEDIVREHMDALSSTSVQDDDIKDSSPDVIEGEYEDISSKDQG